jgi:hypothetical protein
LNIEKSIMDMLTSTSTIDPRMAVILFTVCAVGEFGASIPYVLEGVWLFAGYQFGAGLSTPLHLVGLLFFTQCGRQVGALLFYRMCRFGSSPLQHLYQKLHLKRLFSRLTQKSGALNHVNLSSPFSVAYARLFGMRIPIGLAMAMKRNPKVLSLGVFISSIIFDAIYVLLGMAFGATTSIKPIYVFLASLGALTVLYLTTFVVRLIRKHLKQLATVPRKSGL